jgi:polysaccharide pyruvyl transferase CsaB
MKVKKIVIARMANADYNTGEDAILTSMIHTLSKSREYEITVLSDDPARIRNQYGIKAVESGMKNLLKVMLVIARSDFFIWAGGHMLQDQSSALDVPFHLLRVFWAKITGIPVILYAVGIGPLDTKIGRFFAKKCLNRVDLIITRDKKSKDIIDDIGVINSNVHVTADPAFLVSPTKNTFENIVHKYKIDDDKPKVFIAPRKAFYKVHGFLPATIRLKLNLMPKMFYKKYPVFKKRVAKICDYLISKYDAQIIIYPMDTASNPRDDIVCREIYNLIENNNSKFLIEENITAREVLEMLGRMDLVVSQRLHGLILSSIMNVPMFGISTTGQKDKCRSFMKQINQENFCVDADVIADYLNSSEVTGIIDDLWSKKKEIQEELRTNIQLLKEASLVNEQLIMKFINER